MGYVYFITNGENIKIGYTKNSVQKRLKQLNTGSDKQLYILGYMKGTMADEENLHSKFQQYKIRNNGEWFEPSDDILDYINVVNIVPNCYVRKNEAWNNKVMAMTSVSLSFTS